MSRRTTRAAIFDGTVQLRVKEVELPPLEPHDILLEVSACAICSSDLHSFVQGRSPSSEVMGHEFAGFVEAIGADGHAVRVGDRLAVIPLQVCGECRQSSNRA